MCAATARPRTVLLVENNLDFLMSSAILLRDRNYLVETATSAGEALKKLKDRWFHLLVVDAHLGNEDEEMDLSGVQLTLRDELQVYPCIIYSAYPEEVLIAILKQKSEQRLEILRQKPGQRLARAIVPKSDTIDLGVIVDNIFSLKHVDGLVDVGINFELQLDYHDRCSTIALISWLRDVPNDRHVLLARVDEFEDLLGKGFADAETLAVSLLSQSRNDDFNLLVTPHHGGKVRESLIVKCGEREAIHRERANYDLYIKSRGLKGIAQLHEDSRHSETLHFGLLKYRLPGGVIEDTLSFAEFYHRNTVDTIVKTLDNLFSVLEGLWERASVPSGRGSSPGMLYRKQVILQDGRRWGDIPSALSHVFVSAQHNLVGRTAKTITWRIGDSVVTYPEPYTYLNDIEMRPSALFNRDADLWHVHGDLRDENIRIDDNNHPWLIDFERTGPGPKLQDVVELEASMHFGLVFERQEERLLAFEFALAQENGWGKRLEFPAHLLLGDELTKACEVIAALRLYASKLQLDGQTEYLLGLAYQALRIAVTTPLPHWVDARRHSVCRLQALFMASAYCHLLQKCIPHEGIVVARVVRQVRVDGTLLEERPPGAAWRLLLHLLERPGHEHDIMQCKQILYPSDFEVDDGRFDACWSRLRRSFNEDQRQYLKRIHNGGVMVTHGRIDDE